MTILQTVLLILHVLVALAICGFVLLQHGKGADMGAAFGSGSSGSLFGAAGSANFLSRTTAILAAVFFASSLGLTWFASSHGRTVEGRAARGHGKDGTESFRRAHGSRRASRAGTGGGPGEGARRARAGGIEVGRSAEVNKPTW